MLVVFVSHAGAPGCTTTALAVAAAWPSTDRVLIEADPAGGVLWSRAGIAPDPGLSSLAATARTGLDRTVLDDHTQAGPGGLPMIAGPPSGSVAAQAVAVAAGPVGEWLSGQAGLVGIVDAGRWTGRTGPNAGFVTAADVVVMVAAPVAEQLVPAAHDIRSLQAMGCPVGWCLVGDGPYDAVSVTDAYGVAVLAEISTDLRGAALVNGDGKAKTRARSTLVRDATTLAGHLADQLHTDRTGDPDVTVPTPETDRPRELADELAGEGSAVAGVAHGG